MKKLLAGMLVLTFVLSIVVATFANGVIVGGQEIQEQKGLYNEVPEIQISVFGRQINAISSQWGYLYLVLEYANGEEIFILPNGRNINGLLEPYKWRKVAMLPEDISVGEYKIKAVFSQQRIFCLHFKLGEIYLSTDRVEYFGPGGSCNFIACKQIYLAIMPADSFCNLPKGEMLWHAHFPDGTECMVTQSEMIRLIIYGYIY
jgi:hypothetical protein